MKFTMRMPFSVEGGPRENGAYTAYVLDQHGREVYGSRSKSFTSQGAAYALAMKRAREWSANVRRHAGVG